jgi:hypothetical protein
LSSMDFVFLGDNYSFVNYSIVAIVTRVVA